MEKTTHIAIVTSPGFSHLFPIIEFSKRLVQLRNDFHVTCIIPTLGSPPSSSKAYLQILPPNIDFEFLPPVSRDIFPENTHVSVQIQLTVTHSLPHIRQVLISLASKTQLAALVADPYGFETLEFAKELKILFFFYFPVSAMAFSMLFYLPKLDEKFSEELRDPKEIIQFPGCIRLFAQDLPDAVQDRSSQAYKFYVQRSKSLLSVDGILVNSFQDLEESTIRTLTEGNYGNPPIYPVGPIVQTWSDKETNRPECLRWLDYQSPNSVLYVSFGSGGTLTQDQINELALGLELSGKKFLWVVRAPSSIASAAYLGSSNEDPLQFLPNGFLERTKEQGFVISSWAPQIQILSHNSVGGFLTHCGWNSTLESVLKGVPLITWPLFAEQKVNAALLADGLKVALKPKVNEQGMVEKEEIGKVVKSLMGGEEGKEMRKRMKDLKNAAENALKEDGSSAKTLSLVAQKWKNLGGI